MATLQPTTFHYKGTDRKGKTVTGEISGASSALVKAQLLKQGIRPKIVRKKSKPFFSNAKKIKPLDIAIFTRQLATMIKAGVPLVQSFDIVADGADNPTMKELILNIRGDVAAGTGFAATLRKYPNYFDELFCNLVDAGEQAGALETLLDRIATYKEKTERLKSKIKKAMIYPIAIVVVTFAVTLFLLIKVVPQFAATFRNFGADLPAFTQLILELSNSAQQHWWKWLLGMIIAGFLWRHSYRQSAAFRKRIDHYALKLPVVGNIVYHSIMARYARTLATTFAAGVSLIDSLRSTAGAAGNRVYQEIIMKIRDEVSTGVPLHVAMRSSARFPSMMLQMTAIGEESGDLDSMLNKSATYHEERVEDMVDNLTSLLEPFIMLVLGVIVGGLLIAMYLPIFQLGQII